LGAVVSADSSCVGGALSLVCARNRSRSWPLSRRRGSSRVSPVFRSVAKSEWSSGPAHCFCLCLVRRAAVEWSGVGAKEKLVSLAPRGQARVMSSAVACHDLTNAAVVTGEQELMTLAGHRNIVLPSASAIAPRLFARWPLSPPCGVPQRRRQTNAVVVRGGASSPFSLSSIRGEG